MREATHQVQLIFGTPVRLAAIAILMACSGLSAAQEASVEPRSGLEHRIDGVEPATPSGLRTSIVQAPQPRPETRPLVPLGAPTKISGPMVAGGDVLLTRVTPDGTRVVYGADQDVDASNEIYSVAVGGGPVTQLNPPLVAGGNVLTVGLSGDSARVVYRADQDFDTIEELYSVPIGGGASTKLNGALLATRDVISFAIAPDSSRVIYLADQDADSVDELYSVPIGGGASTKLNGALPVGGDVTTFVFSPDSQTVIYRADQDADEVLELYSVPAAGGASTKLNSVLVAGGDVTPFGFASANGRTYYFADQDTDAKTELYSVPDTGGAVVKLNAPLVAGGETTNAFISTSVVVYLADKDTDSVFELYAVSPTGGASVKLNGPLVAGGGVTSAFLVLADQTVVYLADQDTDGVNEFYSAPVTGGGSTKLNGPLVPGGDVHLTGASAIAEGALPARVVYFADQDVNDVDEVYSAPVPGGGSIKLNGPLVASGEVATTGPVAGLASFTASGLMLYRADQDTDEVIELYVTTTTGVGGVTKLNPPLVAGGDVLDVRFSGVFPLPTSAVYRADQDTDEVRELYSVFLDGDADGDAVADGSDCLAYDSGIWGVPTEVTALLVGKSGTTANLSWTAPVDGGTIFAYDTVRSDLASDFVNATTCIETGDDSDTAAADPDVPVAGAVFYYLVRPENPCGAGPIGGDSGGSPRSARTCP